MNGVDYWQWVLPGVGLFLGWGLKNKTHMPNELIPVALAAGGATVGLVVPGLSVEMGVSLVLGSTAVYELNKFRLKSNGAGRGVTPTQS